MDQPLFSVFDSKASQYLPPFASQNQSTAIRQFSTAVMREGHDFRVHAEDYTLWHVGTFDSEKAKISPAQPPEMVANAHEIRAQLDLVVE